MLLNFLGGSPVEKIARQLFIQFVVEMEGATILSNCWMFFEAVGQWGHKQAICFSLSH